MFSRLKKRFCTKKYSFYSLLSDQSRKMMESLHALARYVENGSEESANSVRQIERDADHLRRILVQALDKSFVTPLDREDIYDLSRSIDDVVDYAYSTVEEMELYEVTADGHVREMVDILMKGAQEVNDAVNYLEVHPKIAIEHAVKAKAFENTMETAYRCALAELFKGTDTVYMLKMREIYRHLSNAADRGDQAANIVSSIVMKHT